MEPGDMPAFNMMWSLLLDNLITKEDLKEKLVDYKLRPRSEVGDIARYLHESTTRALEPWRNRYERSLLRWKQAETRINRPTSEFVAEARQKFYLRAKARTLSKDECMLGSYICGPEPRAGLQYLYHLLFETSSDERVREHNILMLSWYPSAERSSLAEKVMSLTVPIFPPEGELVNLNDAILERLARPQGGGDGPEAFADFYRDDTPLKGGSYYESIVDASGHQRYAVRVAGTEERLDAIKDDMKRLRREMRQSRSAPTSNVRGRGGNGNQGYCNPARGSGPQMYDPSMHSSFVKVRAFTFR